MLNGPFGRLHLTNERWMGPECPRCRRPALRLSGDAAAGQARVPPDRSTMVAHRCGP